MTLQDDIIRLIGEHSMSRPRSLQREVGPSDLAQDCDHCLAAKLAGWDKRPDVAWLAYVGTAVHLQLEQALAGVPGFLQEVEVTVGQVGGRPVKGHADLVHLPSSTVVDYKTAGKAKLDAARRGNIPANYRRQVHLYARGLEVENVAILFLPRNEISLDRAVWWSEPYDAQLAHQTLERAKDIYRLIPDWEDLSRFDRAPGCYDCARYDDAPGAVSGTLESLIGG